MSKLNNDLLSLKNYTFVLWNYRRSHSLLTLRGEMVDVTNNYIYLVFSNLLYFQAPTRWTADFSVASDLEFIEALKKAKVQVLYGEESLEALKENYLLYKGETSTVNILILAKLHSITHDMEPVFE